MIWFLKLIDGMGLDISISILKCILKFKADLLAGLSKDEYQDPPRPCQYLAYGSLFTDNLDILLANVK